MVFEWFWGVQKGMLKKWSLNGFWGSKKVCFKNGLQMVFQWPKAIETPFKDNFYSMLFWTPKTI